MPFGDLVRRDDHLSIAVIDGERRRLTKPSAGSGSDQALDDGVCERAIVGDIGAVVRGTYLPDRIERLLSGFQVGRCADVGKPVDEFVDAGVRALEGRRPPSSADAENVGIEEAQRATLISRHMPVRPLPLIRDGDFDAVRRTQQQTDRGGRRDRPQAACDPRQII